MRIRRHATRHWASGLIGGAVVAVAAALTLTAPVATASPDSDATDAITAAWTAAGGDASSLGAKDGDLYPAGIGFGQNFAGGAIFYTPDTGAKIMYGAILDKYRALGGPADSDLGFPTIDEGPGRVSPDSRNSTFSAADQPVIFWTPDTGAWVVRGAINAAWDRLGGSAGALGVPTADETYDGAVVTQTFTGGQLSFDGRTKTFTTDPPDLAGQLGDLTIPGDATSAINAALRAAGGVAGPLGARAGDQFAIPPDGAGQAFAGGKIFYGPGTGAFAVTGAILEKYEAAGGPTGDLGLPNAPEADGGVPGSRLSSFAAQDNPVIFATAEHGAVIVRGAMKAAWDKLGGAAGSLGVPVSDQSTDGDKVTQKFSAGQLTWDSKNNSFTSDPANLADSLGGLEVPAAPPAATAPPTSEAPKMPNPPKDNAFSFHTWWLWWIIPLALLLLGSLLALLSGRRRRATPEPADVVADDARWPAVDTDQPRVPTPVWTEPEAPAAPASRWDAPKVPDAGVSGIAEPISADHELFTHRGAHQAADDQDAVDTAPTRVHADDDAVDSPTGRHAAIDRPAWSPYPEDPWASAQASLFEPRYQGVEHVADAYGDDHPGPEPAAAAAEDFAVDGEPEPAEWLDADVDDAVDDESYLQQEYVEPEPVESVEPAESEHVEPAVQPVPPAIHLPLEDPTAMPEGYPVKGSITAGVYYTPDSPNYGDVVAEIWFADAEHAEANGFVRAY